MRIECTLTHSATPSPDHASARRRKTLCILPLKKLFWVLFSPVIFSHTQAQDLTGLWQGYITATDASITSGYLINIEKQKDDIFSGRAYIFREGIFDGHLDFIGTSVDSVVKLTELRVLRYRTPPSWFVCVKFCSLDFMHRKSVDHLIGQWHGSIFSGNPCTPGEVILRRYNPQNPEGIQPIPDTVLQLAKKNAGKPMTFMDTELDEPLIVPVRNRVVKMELRDYMKEDNDTVSVYYNRNPFIKRVRIAKKKKVYTVRLDPFSELNEFVIYAENLGDIPPNTSVITIIDGDRKHSVRIESSLQKSAVIYLRYRPDVPASLAGRTEP